MHQNVFLFVFLNTAFTFKIQIPPVRHWIIGKSFEKKQKEITENPLETFESFFFDQNIGRIAHQDHYTPLIWRGIKKKDT